MAVEGKVAKILGNNEIVINRGRREGVRQGMLFEIFAPEGEEVWDPDTGETLGSVEDVKAKAEVTEVKDKLAVARLQNAQDTPFGAVNIGEMQENLQRMFGQMFGDDVQVRGFGTSSGDDPDLESMLGGPLQDLSQVQVGDVVRVTQPMEVLARGALVPAAVAEGQVWLLLTSMFLHSGFIHLALNMLSLYFLGSFVEQA